jgi:hypothetical protein
MGKAEPSGANRSAAKMAAQTDLEIPAANGLERSDSPEGGRPEGRIK